VWYSKTVLQKKLGQRIADLRKTRQLTQTELAKKVGCSVDFISLVERGVNAPSVAGLETFARVLKVEVGQLFRFPGRKPTCIRRRGRRRAWSAH
jgi:transcriptional regulator with XRE-family HTH domain